MLSLQDLQHKVTDSLKSKDETALRVWRMLVARVQAFEKEKGLAAEEQDIQTLALLEQKKRREAASLYQQGRRPELAKQELDEAEVLGQILPTQLTLPELEDQVSGLLAQGSYTQKDLGLVIKALKEQLGSSVDGSTLAQVVKSKLAS